MGALEHKLCSFWLLLAGWSAVGNAKPRHTMHLVSHSASVLLPELCCFWQLVSITRSPCTGRSYFPDSTKLLFLAEEKQLLSRETKLARLSSALFCYFSDCFNALCWFSHAGSHGKRSQFHTVKWSTKFLFFLTFSLSSTADTAARLSLCRGWVYAPNSVLEQD